MTKAKAGSSKSKKGGGKSSAKAAGKTTKKQPRPALIQLDTNQKLDILGVFLVGLAAVTILSLISSSQGAITGQLLGWLRVTFGLGMYVVPVVVGLIGLWLLLRTFERTPRLSGEQIAGFAVFFLIALMTLAWIQAELGGSLGVGLLSWLISAVGEIGAAVLMVVGWLIAIVLLFDVSPSDLATAVGRLLVRFKRTPEITQTGTITPGKPIDMVINAGSKSAANGNGARSAPTRSASPAPAVDLPPDEPALPVGKSTRVSARARPDAPPSGMLGDATMSKPLANSPKGPAPADRVETAPGEPATGPIYPRIIGTSIAWELPKIDQVFDSGEESAVAEEELRKKAKIIESTLRELGVEGKVVEVNRGPTITQFGVEPGWIVKTKEVKERDDEGNIVYDEFGAARVRREEVSRTKVKVSRITALADDLALALAARSIRIEAPVPGRNIVGIEVPNSEVSMVSVRDVIESEQFAKIKSSLRIALGQNVSGQAVAADLGNMPHLLIAGTTGSGKSVCVNAIITCLMAHNTPDDLKFLMVDPKRVELTTYNGVPHLLTPVIVDLEKVTGVLNWVTREMDDRYRRFAKSGSRNIDDHNRKIDENNAREGAVKEPRLPYIIVVIDELADLMMLAPDETEKTLCRLAQMARATGIHLIIATQRPSVDVVTGLIKANFPARIAFSVASSVDSRVILDTTGAERLLGRGDMLYVAPEVGAPQRLQGCFVSGREIERMVRYWKGLRGTEAAVAATPLPEDEPATQAPLFPGSIQAEIEQANANGEDDLLQRAIEVVRAQRKASISLLQRQLRIGYTRAARLIDQMEEKGIVGPATPDSRWREVLLEIDH